MKVKEVYVNNKLKYLNYVIIIKVGVFYETYNNDALLLNNLFGYKIKKIGEMERAGFPLNAYDKVIETLNIYKINYVVINEKTIIKKFLKNNYNKYVCDNRSYINRINVITDKLNSLIYSSDIDNILLKIESIL